MESRTIEGDDQLAFSMRKYQNYQEVTQISPFTILANYRILGAFRNWCLDRGIHSPTAITRKIMEQYRRHLFYKKKADGKPLKASTQNSYLSAVRSFFSWLAKNNMIVYNPSSELELPRRESMLPRDVLTPAEIDRVMDQPNVKIARGLRDRAVLETLYSTGIRRNECINLSFEDINADKGLLMVRQGKGGKDRLVPIGTRACTWIEKYLLEIRPQQVRNDDVKILFLTQYGGPFHPDVLTRVVRRYIRQAGFERGACHLFRHSMATSMLENGADIRYIQAILGHVSLDTTQVYTRVSILKLKEVHSLTHPARLKKDTAEIHEHRI